MLCNKLTKQMLAGTSKSGVKIYHCLRWCGRIKREYSFTLNTNSVLGEKNNNLDGQFDVRSLPIKYLPENINDRELKTKPIDWIIRAVDDGFDLSQILSEKLELDEDSPFF